MNSEGRRLGSFFLWALGLLLLAVLVGVNAEFCGLAHALRLSALVACEGLPVRARSYYANLGFLHRATPLREDFPP